MKWNASILTGYILNNRRQNGCRWNDCWRKDLIPILRLLNGWTILQLRKLTRPINVYVYKCICTCIQCRCIFTCIYWCVLGEHFKLQLYKCVDIPLTLSVLFFPPGIKNISDQNWSKTLALSFAFNTVLHCK